MVKDKYIIFKMDLQDDLPRCLLGDDVRLRQVLLNVLNNAVKFTDEGYIRFSVSSSATKIHFHVSDTGIGIRKEDIPLIFENFNQAEWKKYSLYKIP